VSARLGPFAGPTGRVPPPRVDVSAGGAPSVKPLPATGALTLLIELKSAYGPPPPAWPPGSVPDEGPPPESVGGPVPGTPPGMGPARLLSVGGGPGLLAGSGDGGPPGLGEGWTSPRMGAGGGVGGGVLSPGGGGGGFG
jgi:hypothetical protein